MGDELGPLLGLYPSSRRKRSAIRTWLIVASGALALISISSVVTMAAVAMLLAHDSPAPAPALFNVDVTFSRHDEYHDFSHDRDGLWDELRPSNGGFNKDGDGIAFFHQLHCLQMIREQMQSLLISSGNYVTSKDDVEIRRLPVPHQDGMGKRSPVFLPKRHVAHCFDYLRQVSSKLTLAGR